MEACACCGSWLIRSTMGAANKYRLRFSVRQPRTAAVLKLSPEMHSLVDRYAEAGRKMGLPELGDIVYVELPSIGTRLAAGETFGNVESVKSVSDLYCPVAGVVADINTRLGDSPELVNSDPYGEGWMVRLEPENPADLEGLLGPEEYSDYIGAEAE